LKYIDLTMPLNQLTPVYPGDPKPEFKQFASCEIEGWNAHIICMNSHFGTHIDAPWHMLKEGKRLSDFPITKFIGRAIMFDVRGQREIDIELDAARENDILILRTDHSKLAGQSDFYERNPVISQQLANRIVEKKLSIVGIDSHTPDLYPFEIHKLLLKHDILILENLVDLDKIETNTFTIMVLPMKLDKMDGAPCRVVAEINDF
jgi:kynurenine formamidase